MEERDLAPFGFPGYKIREDGWMINKNGRHIGGNGNGQVRMQNGEPGGIWLSLAVLVAKAWIPNPYNWFYVRYLDGDKNNMHYTNLEWCPVKHQANPTHARVLQLLRESWHVEDIMELTGASEKLIRSVASARYKELTMFPPIKPE